MSENIQNFPIDEFYYCWEKIYGENKFEFSSFVHKDYEFVNLHFLKQNSLHFKCGIIDFQSAFLGFVGWDLFSILENPRINFTRKYNEFLIKYFYENIEAKININFLNFRNQYYLLNLGRLTRLMGRWVKLFNESNNLIFLDYLKTTENRVLYCLENIKIKKLTKIYIDVLTK